MSSRTWARSSHAAHLRDVRVQGRHPLESGASEALALQIAQVCHLMHEDVGASGESDQVFVHRGVAGEDDGAVRGVEAVGEGGVGVPVGHGYRRHVHHTIVEDGCRIPRGTRGRRRDGNVDRPDERARVRHVDVEGHDVQVVGVAGQDVLHEVGHAGKRSVWVDGRLSVERGVTVGGDGGSTGATDKDRREGVAVGSGPGAPRIQEHAGQITRVVHMEVREEHGLEPSEIEAGLGEGRRRTSSAIDHEDTSVDHDG